MSSATPVPAYLPRTFSQILDRLYRIVRADLRTHLGIALLPASALFLGYGSLVVLWTLTFFRSAMDGRQLFAGSHGFVIFGAFLGFMLVYLVVLGLFFAAASYAAVRADYGLPITVRQAYAVAWGRAGHFVRLLLSMYGLCFAPALLLEAVMAGLVSEVISSKQFPPSLIAIIPVGALLLLATLAAGVFACLRLSLAFPASVFESLDIRNSIKRSWALTRGAIGKIFLTILAVYAVIYIATMIVMMIVMFVAMIGSLASSTFLHLSPNAVKALVVCAVAGYLILMSVFSACSWTGFATGLSIIYNDQRLRATPPLQTGAEG
jgi:hypothetical protein